MDISHKNSWEQFLDEFIEVFSIFGFHKYKVFICGSYIEDNLVKLREIRNVINNFENHLAFFEDQFRTTHNENLVYKFDLLAKISDDILMIIEQDKGGHMIEMGILISSKEFLSKTKVFVLKDTSITQMLTSGGLLSPFFTQGKNFVLLSRCWRIEINNLRNLFRFLIKNSSFYLKTLITIGNLDILIYFSKTKFSRLVIKIEFV